MTEILKLSDAEQAKQTGGMLAFYPAAPDAARYAMPGGEPVGDLHVTLIYFGEDVTGLSPVEMLRWLDDWIPGMRAVQARVFGHATFNPDGRYDPCAVYLVGDAPAIGNLHAEAVAYAGSMYDLPAQHAPYHAHMTAGYGMRAEDLTEVGELLLDRVVLEWAGQSHVYSLASD